MEVPPVRATLVSGSWDLTVHPGDTDGVVIVILGVRVKFELARLWNI